MRQLYNVSDQWLSLIICLLQAIGLSLEIQVVLRNVTLLSILNDIPHSPMYVCIKILTNPDIQ
jgi:hypothetical protein